MAKDGSPPESSLATPPSPLRHNSRIMRYIFVKIRFFYTSLQIYKNILKQFNFQQKHIRFIFLSVSLQKIETYCDDTYKYTYIG